MATAHRLLLQGHHHHHVTWKTKTLFSQQYSESSLIFHLKNPKSLRIVSSSIDNTALSKSNRFTLINKKNNTSSVNKEDMNPVEIVAKSIIIKALKALENAVATGVVVGLLLLVHTNLALAASGGRMGGRSFSSSSSSSSTSYSSPSSSSSSTSYSSPSSSSYSSSWTSYSSPSYSSSSDDDYSSPSSSSSKRYSRPSSSSKRYSRPSSSSSSSSSTSSSSPSSSSSSTSPSMKAAESGSVSGFSESVNYDAPSPPVSGFYVRPAMVFGYSLILVIIAYAAFLFKSSQKTTVLMLQVGLLGMVKSLQKDLNTIAETADTSNSQGLHYVLTETILALLRQPDCCISAYSSVDVKSSMDEGEKRFDQLSIEERGKFDEETLVNVDNIKKQSSKTARESGFNNEYLVLTILVAVRGIQKLPCINNIIELKEVLQNLATIPADRTLAVEVLWTPQKEDDTLSEQELLQDYPLLRPL